MKSSVKQMVTMGVLASLSIVLMLITRFPIIPIAPYLVYEAADIPVLIGSFLFGPVAGFVLTVVVSTIQTLFVGKDGWVGLVMHIVATGTFAVTAGLIYKKLHSIKGALLALAAGTLAMTLIMIPVNLIIQPNFYGVPLEAVKSMILPAILPFNLIKAGINSVVTLIVYKTVSKTVRKL